MDRPAASASAIVRAQDGAAARISSRQRRRRARTTPRTTAGPASAARSPSAGPPRSHPAAHSAQAATATRRRRSGAVGSRPSSPARRSGSSQPRRGGGHPRAFDLSDRVPRARHRSAGCRGRKPGGRAHGGPGGRGGRKPGRRAPPAGRRVCPRRRPVLAAAAQRRRPPANPGRPRRGPPPRPRRRAATPSAPRAWQTTRSTASATCSRIAASGRPTPAISASVSSRRSASAALPAWMRAQRARVAGGEGAQEVERLGAAHLAHDDAVRAHPERVADEPADGHLAAALEVGRPRLEPHDVGQGEAQLRGVLDGDDPLRGIGERGERAEGRRLAGAGAAADQQRPARGDRRAEEVQQRCGRASRGRRDRPAGSRAAGSGGW